MISIFWLAMNESFFLVDTVVRLTNCLRLVLTNVVIAHIPLAYPNCAQAPVESSEKKTTKVG